SAIPDAGLAHFVLLMGINYAANQIAPTHVCVPIAAEHFNVSFWAMVKKTLPVILTFYVGLFLYYMALKAIFPAMP
ncbi:hypothetical protein LJC42_08715, partial [Eubacteriales bacterium OttesenSCG-928-K08]|nr:hypothetical protein [Eubacteriales bacterium OttesenSCG-928-K08]